MEIPNPGRSIVEVQALNMNHHPSSAREAVERGTIKPMEPCEVKRNLRELSKLVYAHKKMAPFYHSDVSTSIVIRWYRRFSDFQSRYATARALWPSVSALSMGRELLSHWHPILDLIAIPVSARPRLVQ